MTRIILCTFLIAAGEMPPQIAPRQEAVRWDGVSRLKSSTTLAELHRAANDASHTREKREEVQWMTRS